MNLFKRRGHFLNAALGSGDGGNRKIEDIYKDIVSSLREFYDIEFPDKIDSEKLEEILCSRKISRTKKSEEVALLLGVTTKEKRAMAVIKMLCGRKVKTIELFEKSDDDEKTESADICFADASYVDKADEISKVLGDNCFTTIELLKELFDNASLKEILKGKDYLSDARVESYEKHNKDLKILKSLFKKYGRTEDGVNVEYDEMFRNGDKGTYSAYVNSSNSSKVDSKIWEDGKQRRSYNDRSQEAFYKNVKKHITDWKVEDKNVFYVLSEIENETFMPKQLTASNGVIPNQVHLKELKVILKNAEAYLSFLKEVDESGLSVSERIIQLYSFQIPYYVGPVSENSARNHGNGWVVRKETGTVLPWNFKDKIDLRKTNEAFIKNLVRTCTYMKDEKVMPKQSLMYEKYCVLNEINNIKICGSRITPELKQDIFNSLYKQGKRVTKAQLVKYLMNKNLIQSNNDITGIDVNLVNFLGSYGKFKAIFGEDIEKDTYKKKAERIIYLSTIYGDSKPKLKEVLKDEFKDELNDDQIKRIVGTKFKDWARFSTKFLELEGCDKETGEIITLNQALWNYSMNLMELIHSNAFTFADELEKQVNDVELSLSEIKPEDLDEMYFSAPVKRMIWQTLLVVKEIEKIMGGAPKRIFVEMTRSEDDKKQRTESRGKKLIDLYKAIKNEDNVWVKDIDSKDCIQKIEFADKDGSLRSKKLFLYYTQLGRDMYTGDVIDIDDLLKTDKYDIDHIYPQHFVKDDSILNNMVLVDKNKNNHKQDQMISAEIRNKCYSLWKTIHELGFINDEKYYRLTRTTDFSDNERAGFIARQMVETSQATKGISDLLKALFEKNGTDIVYAKARNVSDFRQEYNFPKSRLVNDFHHANDAYLNIVVGNAYFVKFTKNPLNFINKEYNKDQKRNNYHLGVKMFEHDIIRGDQEAWIASSKGGEEKGTIVTVRKMMSKNTPILSRMNFTGHGGIANQTLYSTKKAKNDGSYLPLKGNDPRLMDVTKYGGFTCATTAYLFLVEHDKKKKRIRTLETVPVYMKDAIEKNPERLEEYCLKELGLINPDVRVRKIKLQSLYRRNGYYGHITGASGERFYYRNAIPLCLNKQWVKYVKLIEKSIEKDGVIEGITEENNIELYRILSDKMTNSILMNRPNNIGEKLKIKFDEYKNLLCVEQIKILFQILSFLSLGSNKANLELLHESKGAGECKISKEVTTQLEFELINQSATGLFENRIDLLTV